MHFSLTHSLSNHHHHRCLLTLLQLHYYCFHSFASCRFGNFFDIFLLATHFVPYFMPLVCMYVCVNTPVCVCVFVCVNDFSCDGVIIGSCRLVLSFLRDLLPAHMQSCQLNRKWPNCVLVLLLLLCTAFGDKWKFWLVFAI